MNINNDKEDIFLKILISSYLKQKPLKDGCLKISDKTIESQGLNIKEIFDVICPILKYKEYLISYSELIVDSSSPLPINNKKEIKEWNENSELYYSFEINEDKIIKELDTRNADSLSMGSLEGRTPEFDDVTSSIIIDGKKCPLPPAKNEGYFAKAIFSRMVNEPVDWSILYEEMTGNEVEEEHKKNKKALDDTIRKLNTRVKDIFKVKENLIVNEGKSVIRRY